MPKIIQNPMDKRTQRLVVLMSDHEMKALEHLLSFRNKTSPRAIGIGELVRRVLMREFFEYSNDIYVSVEKERAQNAEN